MTQAQPLGARDLPDHQYGKALAAKWMKGMGYLGRSQSLAGLECSSTIADRVAQTVVKQWLEPKLDPLFHENSYGYRPGRSAHDAIAVTKRRCWDYDWIVELDVKGLFDNIDHDLLMKALRKHCQTSWVLLYVERWLKAPMQTTDGAVKAREKGTPQGGVITPLTQKVTCVAW